MASLADIFTPSFFIILGIVVLLIALLVVYFENKMREQNHKIASMLSLVSTLAEDTNGLKLGLNHLAVTMGGGPHHFHNKIPEVNLFDHRNLGNNEPEGKKQNNSNQLDLIEVSDDEESEDEECEENFDDSGDEEEINEIDDETNDEESSDDDENEEEKDNVKIIKLNISQDESDKEDNSFELENADDLEDLCGDFEASEDVPEISTEYAEEILSLKYDQPKEEILTIPHFEPLLEESNVPLSTELKTISINLGEESHTENIDFKKLQLPKLRSIAIEKGLTSSTEAQKLKKPDLLKLLGSE